jgi:protein-tyrosine phosphatase
LIMEFTILPFDFSGKVYRSAMPYSAYDPDGALIQAYLDSDISNVVVLSGISETRQVSGRDLEEMYRNLGIKVLPLPIEDYGVADLDEVRETISEILSRVQTGENVAIHCHAGIGRTGMLVACLVKIGLGYSPEESIQWVREHIPGAIEVPEQEKLVREI